MPIANPGGRRGGGGSLLSIGFIYNNIFLGDIKCLARRRKLDERDIDYLRSCFASILSYCDSNLDTQELVWAACEQYDDDSSPAQQIGPVDFDFDARPNGANQVLEVNGNYAWGEDYNGLDSGESLSEDVILYEIVLGVPGGDGILEPSYSYGSIGYVVAESCELDDETVAYIQGCVEENCDWDERFGVYINDGQVVEEVIATMAECGFTILTSFASEGELIRAGYGDFEPIPLVV